MKKLNFDFKKYKKQEWLDLIAKSLKHGSLEDFVWYVDAKTKGEPFAHRDDLPADFLPLDAKTKNNEWLSGLDYSLITTEELNRYMKVHTAFGLQSAIIHITNSSVDLDQMFRGLDITKLDLVFNTSFGIDLILFLENFKDFLDKKQLNNKKIVFTVRLPINRPFMLMELYKYATLNFPKINFYFKTDRAYSYEPVKYLTDSFDTLTDYIKKSDIDKDILAWYFDKMKVHFFATENFLADIAMLRAFKIVCANYTKAFGITPKKAKIILGINHDAFTGDENNDLIIATVIIMAGAIAGVHSINPAPAEEVTDPVNMMRLFLNIQNIMKLESNMALVRDALAGSYAIEDLTNKIATEVWKELA